MSSRLRCLALSAAAFCAVAGFSQKAAAQTEGYEEPKAYVGGGAFWNKPTRTATWTMAGALASTSARA